MDLDSAPEGGAQTALQLLHVDLTLVGDGRDVGGDLLGCGVVFAHQSLHLTHRQLAVDRQLGQREHLLVVVQTQKGAGVAHGETLVLHEGEDLVGQLQKTEHIGHRRTALARLRGHFLLLETEFFDQSLVCKGFFNGIEIFSLHVLDQSHLCDLEIVTRHDDGGDLVQARQPGGSPAALACDDLVIFSETVHLADHDGLDHAVLTDRICQELQGIFIKALAGLIPTGRNAADLEAGLALLRGFHHIIVQKGVEIPSQTALSLCHSPSPLLNSNVVPITLHSDAKLLRAHA